MAIWSSSHSSEVSYKVKSLGKVEMMLSCLKLIEENNGKMVPTVEDGGVGGTSFFQRKEQWISSELIPDVWAPELVLNFSPGLQGG